MKLGIVGLPNVGKSTLFNAITKAGAEMANYPFCTIEKNVGVVNVPDERLDKLAKFYNSKKITPATIEFVDIAGLVKGASKGEGLGNKFLSHIREVDAIVHVVRLFKDELVTHVEGSVDPIRDIETINLELILADLDTLTRRIDKTRSLAKGLDKRYVFELEVLEKLYKALEKGNSARTVVASNEEEAEFIESLYLLTTKKVLYCMNVSENASETELIKIVEDYASKENSEAIAISSKIEAELSELSEEDRVIFMEELGITESGLNRLVTKSYKLLGLMSYLTAGEKETRAWTIPINTKAPKAAGKIHTDFEKGFIRAEVINYQLLLDSGSYAVAKEKGRVRSEGKEYILQDGDVVLFRFNV